MIDVDIVGVRVEMSSNQPVLLLRESRGTRYLPIWIGVSEATAIAFAQQGVQPPRPLTHDLIEDILKALKVELCRVEIADLQEGVFYANLLFSNGAVVSSRPSDAIAIALRSTASVAVAKEVLDAAGIEAPAEEENEVEAFREFLESVNPEDFDGPGSSGPSA